MDGYGLAGLTTVSTKVGGLQKRVDDEGSSWVIIADLKGIDECGLRIAECGIFFWNLEAGF
jgi:hypothetical protein